MTQPSFFQQGEDLPLFSQTAPKGKVNPFTPKPRGKQDTIPVDCPACMDTGNIGGKSCWCQRENTKDESMINYQETDLNRQLCRDAHRGTSFSPDIRAQQEIDGYMAEMKAVSTRFAPFATEGNEKALRAALEQYRLGYLKRLEARLSAKANCMSTMITGSSNFNHRRNEKANNTEHRRTTEFIEWREKALKRLNRDYNPAAIARRPIMSDEADAIQQLQAKIEAAEKDQAMMKAVNKIIRGKKLDDGQKAAEIDKLGMPQELFQVFLRTNGAWQRLLNDNSRRVVEGLINGC